MGAVMTEAEAQRILDECSRLFADVVMTSEPEDEFEVLDERLARYGFNWKESIGDGNCVPRSIADQLWGCQIGHKEVRRAGVARLIGHRHFYEDVYYQYTHHELSYDEYVAKMACVSQDVDPLFTQAICDAYGIRIVELVSLPEYCIAEFTPLEQRLTATIYLVSSFTHSDSMYPAQD